MMLIVSLPLVRKLTASSANHERGLTGANRINPVLLERVLSKRTRGLVLHDRTRRRSLR